MDNYYCDNRSGVLATYALSNGTVYTVPSGGRGVELYTAI